MSPRPDVSLRDVDAGDLPVFFEHQRDPQAARMAAFTPRDLDAFTTHWTGTILGNRAVVAKTVLADGDVAGNVVSWEQDGERLVGYWIGSDHWGRGVATAALSLFLDEIDRRPLRARVAVHNPGSIRVLEKCGFDRIGRERGGDGVDELVYELR